MEHMVGKRERIWICVAVGRALSFLYNCVRYFTGSIKGFSGFCWVFSHVMSINQSPILTVTLHVYPHLILIILLNLVSIPNTHMSNRYRGFLPTVPLPSALSALPNFVLVQNWGSIPGA